MGLCIDINHTHTSSVVYYHKTSMVHANCGFFSIKISTSKAILATELHIQIAQKILTKILGNLNSHRPVLDIA